MDNVAIITIPPISCYNEFDKQSGGISMGEKMFTYLLHERHGLSIHNFVFSLIFSIIFFMTIVFKNYIPNLGGFGGYCLIYSALILFLNISISRKNRNVRALFLSKFYLHSFNLSSAIYIIFIICNKEIIDITVTLFSINIFFFIVFFVCFNAFFSSTTKLIRKFADFKNKRQQIFSYKTNFIICLIINSVLINLYSICYINTKDANLVIFLTLFTTFLFILRNIYTFPFEMLNAHTILERPLTSFVSLNYKEIVSSKLYFESLSLVNKYRVFKIDLTNVIEYYRIGKVDEISISNLNYIKSDFFDKNTVSNPYFFFAKAITAKNDYFIIKLIIRSENKNIVHKMKIIIDFNQMKKETIITNCEIYESYKSLSPFSISKYVLRNKKAVDGSAYHSILFYNYQKDESYIDQKIPKSNSKVAQHDERKWIYHDADFGKGKSVTDLLFASKLEKNPIIISAYEERSKNDFLYTVYKAVYETVSKPSTKHTQSTFMYYLLVLFAIYTAIFSNYSTICGIFQLPILLSIITNFIRNNLLKPIPFDILYFVLKISILIFLLPYIIYKIVKFLLPYIVIFKNNTSYYYQDFFAIELLRMIKKNNSILIIEDIDRLNNRDEIESIFATLSLLNSYSFCSNDLLGVISFEKNRMNSLTDENFMENIENKLIRTTFDSHYKDQSMSKYIDSVQNFLHVFYRKVDGSINKKDFRTARSNIVDILQNSELCYNYHGDDMKNIKVVAAIIKKGDEILIAKRLKGEFAGLWEFPGGKMEQNETPEQALKRELEEEMGVSIKIHDYLITSLYDYSTFHLSMDCFLCELENENVVLNDHSAIKWISIDTSIADIEWIPADIQVMQHIQSQIK